MVGVSKIEIIQITLVVLTVWNLLLIMLFTSIAVLGLEQPGVLFRQYLYFVALPLLIASMWIPN